LAGDGNTRCALHIHTAAWLRKRPGGHVFVFYSPLWEHCTSRDRASTADSLGRAMADDLLIGLDALIRSIGINRVTPHALLVGAGASISSGVPSAVSCIWEWKRAIFLTRSPGLEVQFAELSLPAVRQKIQRWLDAQRIYPADGAPDEYGVYIQECFPI